MNGLAIIEDNKYRELEVNYHFRRGEDETDEPHECEIGKVWFYYKGRRRAVNALLTPDGLFNIRKAVINQEVAL